MSPRPVPQEIRVPLLVCPSCHAALTADSPYCPHCGPERRPVSLTEWALVADPDVATRLGRALGAQYTVRRFLGRGGFAEVYEVEDADLQRRLAVKVLRPDIGWTGGMLARFKQEARAIARLNHPHTVPIHFVGEGEGLVFYAMPYVEGQSLADLLRLEGRLDPARAVAIAAPILEALDYAHRNGLVHRDIKPENILVESESGRPLLVDFGIAKNVDGTDAHHTQSGFVVGTPLYMSPEQALGQPNVDARTDVYSMGAVLFQMLTGSPPFDGTTSQEIVGKHLSEAAPAPASRNVELPRWLCDVIARCLAKRPAERYQSAADVLAALREGRYSGPQNVLTASRMTARLGRDAPTLQMEAAIAPAAPRRRAWAGRLALAAAAIVLLVGLGYALRPAAALVLQNRLLDPIALTVAGADHVVAPGDSIRVPLPRGAALAANWRTLPARSAGGGLLGLALAGNMHEAEPRGDVRRVVDLWTIGRSYLAPVVANRTAGPVDVTLHDPAGRATPCHCPVAAGATESLGYHDPTQLGQLEFTDQHGNVALVGPLAGRADRATGAAFVQLDAADFAPAATRGGDHRARAPADPRLAPDSVLIPKVRPILAETTLVPAARDTMPRRPPPPQLDPLRGTVTNR